MSGPFDPRLTLFVVGTPAPQGSKAYKGHRAGKPVLVESSKEVGPWREVVALKLAEAAREQGWIAPSGPVVLSLTFYLHRPVSAPRRRVWPDRKPDLDKLIRSTCDAMTTAGVIEDDARVQSIDAQKVYARSGQPTGVRIVLSSMVSADA